jgi:hypothetical protein
MSPTDARPPKMLFVQKVLSCWDMNRNYISLTKADAGHPGLRTLNGLRVIAIMFVVLGHTYAFMPASNQAFSRGVVEQRFASLWFIGALAAPTASALCRKSDFHVASTVVACVGSDPPNDGIGFLSVRPLPFLTGCQRS